MVFWALLGRLDLSTWDLGLFDNKDKVDIGLGIRLFDGLTITWGLGKGIGLLSCSFFDWDDDIGGEAVLRRFGEYGISYCPLFDGSVVRTALQGTSLRERLATFRASASATSYADILALVTFANDFTLTQTIASSCALEILDEARDQDWFVRFRYSRLLTWFNKFAPWLLSPRRSTWSY